MAKLVIIAGPQSSGKTTLFNVLKNRYPNLRFIDEVNVYQLAGENHPGGAFSDKTLELKLLEEDLNRLKNVDDKRTTVIETGIFHLVYCEKFCGRDTARIYLEKYVQIYNKLQPLLFFIDTKPEISWRRRQEKYKDRIARAGITDEKDIIKKLSRYQKHLFALYPIWLKFFDKIPYEKIIYRNSYVSEAEFIREAFLELQKSLLQ